MLWLETMAREIYRLFWSPLNAGECVVGTTAVTMVTTPDQTARRPSL